MLYSVYDTYLGHFTATGRNKRTKRGAVDSIIKMMSDNDDIDKSFINCLMREKEEWINNCDYRVLRHKRMKKDND